MHAGFSRWQDSNKSPGCEKGINRSSIGIENVNKGFTEAPLTKGLTWYEFNHKQIQSLGLLSKEIINTHKIDPTCVVGHADIATPYGRKQDPGILFPWGDLYSKYNVGAWLNTEEMNPEYIESNLNPKEKFIKEPHAGYMSRLLHDYGYTGVDRNNLDPKNEVYLGALLAFQTHFSKNRMPDKYQSPFSIEDQKWAYGLVSKYKDGNKSGVALHRSIVSISKLSA